MWNAKYSNYDDQITYKKHCFYLLKIYLNCGCNLSAKDYSGTSDPYVKFKLGNKQIFKSRIVYKNLNPKFDQFFSVPIKSLNEPLLIKVYDYDFGFTDDFLGTVQLDLTQLKLNCVNKLVLSLSEDGKLNDQEEDCGQLELDVTLEPKSLIDRIQFFNNENRIKSSKKSKIQEWDSVVNILLIEAKCLPTNQADNLIDTYVRFKLGDEKFKSKIIYKNLNPKWNEQFDLHLFENQTETLEIFIHKKDSIKNDFLYKNEINLSTLTKNETHKLTIKFDEFENLKLILLLTITEIKSLQEDTYENVDYDKLNENYSLLKTFYKLNDVGHLIVQVIKAQDLIAADFSGKSDPFCVLELVNNRLRTNTQYKTLEPTWNKTFFFNVQDIHEMLKVIVYDEDADKKVEFLGQVIIPLLKITNDELKWYKLKDQTLLNLSKGQILLKMHLIYNPLRAIWNTISPREKKIMKQENKFKRLIFLYNVNRLKMVLIDIYFLINLVKECFQWKNKLLSLIGLCLFCFFTITFQPYMMPIFLLLLFLKNYLQIFFMKTKNSIKDVIMESLEESHEKEEEKSEKKSFKEKIHILQETSAQIQNVIGKLASFAERVINVFNFSVPFLSYIAITALIILLIVLHFVPIRYLILVWGLNKFTKNLRLPDSLPNNELLDFISRVPDNNDHLGQKEICHLQQENSKNRKKRY